MLTKILVVDDTVTYRRILSDVVSGIPEVRLVGSAPNGRIALKKIDHLHPDLVLLDVEMPEMDGLATLRAIKSRYEKIGVIMVSGMDPSGSNITIKALENGAIDFIAKPTGGTANGNIDLLRKRLRPLINAFLTRQFTEQIRAERPSPLSIRDAIAVPKAKSVSFAPTPSTFRVVGIGSSTGGPKALAHIIPKLPQNFPVPVVVVQHMPPLFTQSLAKSLDEKSTVRVKEAEDNEPLLPGVVYIAPGGRHTVVRNSNGNGHGVCIGLVDSPPVKSCRPSVDVLFRSLGVAYGGHVLATVMTGMGDDSLDGVIALKRKGCYCLTQSAETCVVYGMPRAIDEARLSDESTALENIADRIVERINQQFIKVQP